MPRIRLRLWWLMGLIAVIGIALTAWIEVPRLRQWSRECQYQAGRFAELERHAASEWEQQEKCRAFWSALAEEREKNGVPHELPDGAEPWAETVARTKEQATWHTREAALWAKKVARYSRLRHKWQRGASYPWMTIEPDPPEFEGMR